MEFRILGFTEVLEEDRSVELPAGRARALLALLIIHAGEPLAAERLIDELWGEGPPPTAATILHGLVSRLRKALESLRTRGGGAQLLETVGAGYRLAVEPTVVDAHRFTGLVREARTEPPDLRAALLAEALALWRGPALAEFVYEPFAQRAIAALEERRLEALELRFEAELALGRDGQLVADLQTAIAAHPFHERLRGLLMVALYRAGRQAEALEAYRAAREFLLEETGLEPSPALSELEAGILRQDPSLELERTVRPVLSRNSSWLPRERRGVTVVVANVAPYADATADVEAMDDAGEHAAAVASEVLHRNGGRVEQYPGDQVVAFFGFPAAHEDDTLRAVNAALQVRTAVHRLNDEADLGSVTHRARIGIEAGEVIVRPSGTLAEAIRGPAVSAAWQLPHAAADAEVLVGPGAQRLLRGTVIMQPIEVTTGQPDRAWRVLEVVAQAQAIPRSFDAPMIGRQSELTQLRSGFRRALRTGRVVPITVVGEAGIGKSRLTREVVATVAEDARALILRCPSPGDAMGFYPVRTAIVEAAGVVGWRTLHDILADAHDGTHAMPAIADAVPLRLPPSSADEILPPLRLFLETLARRHPVIAVFEDLHWADPAFRNVTERLAAELAGPILLLCVARPEAFDDAPPLGQVVALEPLDAPDIAQIAQERAGLLGERPLKRIIDLSQGNPLFAEQLVAELEDGDMPTIPASLAGMLSLRLDRLGPGERDVLRIASIIGLDVELEVVYALLPEEAQPFLERHLQTLERRRLVERVTGRVFRFAHPLIRAAAYQTMTRDDRERLERAVMSHLEHAPA